MPKGLAKTLEIPEEAIIYVQNCLLDVRGRIFELTKLERLSVKDAKGLFKIIDEYLTDYR